LKEAPPLVASNVARDIELFPARKEGFHTWSLAEVERYEERPPLGTPARWVLALLIFTGQRKSDLIRLGREHVTKRGDLHFTQAKNDKRNPVKVEIPILPELREALNACPSFGKTFLQTIHPEPYTFAGFGSRFRAWCDQAGLPECSSHVLRKAGATIAAENGATDAQMMAIFGWADHRQAAHYTRKAERKKMARSGMHLLVPQRDGVEDGND
jgi:integrase